MVKKRRRNCMKKYTIYDFENHTTKFMDPIMIFISQPFTGFSKEDVLKIRHIAELSIKEQHPEDYIHFIDTSICYDIEDPIEGLGAAIALLSQANIAYFVRLHYDDNAVYPMSRGCNIEYRICKDYNIPTGEVHVSYWKSYWKFREECMADDK
jgi:hypothetical protein